MTQKWHALKADEVLKELGSHRAGLTDAEAAERQKKYGFNELPHKKKTSPLIVFLRQFLSPLIYILIVAAVISLLADHVIDALVIFGVLLLNATVGFIQEIRAEKAMEALMRLAAPKATVRRGGVVKDIPARELVPGDILLLETGDSIPADARLLELSNLKVNEASLTGESMPVEKHSGAEAEETSLADRRNMLYMSTVVTIGRGEAVVTATGKGTAIGEIAAAIQEVRQEKTPLQQSIARVSRYIIIIVIGILILLVVMGLLQGLGLFDLFLLAIAAAVSAIPEGLPAVLTVVLAVGMSIMARRHALIRKLAAVETLGSATVICTDKTGTLTMNEMTVRRLYVGGQWLEVSGQGYQPQGSFTQDGRVIDPAANQAIKTHLEIGALCNDALLTCESDFCNIYGDPTEGALVVLAAKAGLDKEKMEHTCPRLDEIPFQSEKQYMATLHARGARRMVYMKGSVERLLDFSQSIVKDGKVAGLTDEDRRAIMAANSAMARQAMRVIATAYYDADESMDELSETAIKGKLVFAGLSGMADPPRAEAREAIRQCYQAGIKVIMITGDHKETAESVGRQLEMRPGEVVTGMELHQLSDEDLARQIEKISIFARIEPLQKLRIINALKSRGHIVAMTGDGVNDAPALKAANIGISMGITGTDIAKEASDMVLADDNFASIVAAIEEGRAIFERLRNVLFFLLGTNLGELIALTLSVAVLGAAPLLPVQIIWVNLVTDSSAAIPLGLEPKSGDELRQPPRHPAVGLIFPGLTLRILFMALLEGSGVFIIFAWAQQRYPVDEARAIAFTAMVAFEWFRAFNARSDHQTVFQLGFWRNRVLILSISAAILLQLAVLYIPPLQIAFRTVPLTLDEWGVVILGAGSLFAVEELRKFFFPRLFQLGKWQPGKVG